MIKHEQYYYDETEVTTDDASDWVEMKQINITRDAFNYNFVQLKFTLTLKCPIAKKGEVAIFIDDEEKPRVTIPYDKPLQDHIIKEVNTYDLTYGTHTITLCLKGSITNTGYKIEVLRIMTLHELTGLLVPMMVMSDVL